MNFFMKRRVHFFLLWLYPSLLIAGSYDGEVPVVYGGQDVEKMAGDLQRLEKFVYRTLGPNRLHKPITEDASNGMGKQDSVPQAQLDILNKKIEDMSQEIPSLLNRLEQSEHTIQKLVENNKTAVQYLTHFKKMLAEEQARNQALEEKVSKLQKQDEGALMESARPLGAVLPEAIPSLPPLEGSSPMIEDKVEMDFKGNEPLAEVPEVPEIIELSVEDLEKKARTALLTAQYDVAEKAFESLLEKDLGNEQAASAHFYLGEIAHVKKNHAKASEHYLKAFQKAPNGSKAPKSLLKLSMKLHELDKKKAACASLNKLIAEYPTADSATCAMAQAKRKEYQCAP